MLSQFTREGNNACLSDLGYRFEKDVYPIGRLDSDSEGLLLLTNDKKINHLLLHPFNQHERTYLVQCEGAINTTAIHKLSEGIKININGKIHHTLPAQARIIDEPDYLPQRRPPIRFRKNIPTSWVEIKLTEGKNRQVRKMFAAAGYPVLRLVRIAIEDLILANYVSGVVEKIERKKIYESLKLKT
jgi:23S rRNA pseudouridine2457 synthase